MSDETNASQEVRAAEEVQEELEEKEAQLEEIQAEPEDNSERSRLGRKVKKIEESLLGEVTRLRQELDEMRAARQKEEIDPDDIVTVGGLEKFLSDRDRKIKEATVKYQTDYTSTFYDLVSKLDDDEAQEVEEEMLANFDRKLSDNPVNDAHINFLKAQNAVYKKKVRTSPLKGGTPQGINSETKMQGKKKKAPELSEFAKKFIEKTGKSQEWVENALGE